MSLLFLSAHDDLRQSSLPEMDPLGHSCRCQTSGFSVVELLVVLAVFGIVIRNGFFFHGQRARNRGYCKARGIHDG